MERGRRVELMNEDEGASLSVLSNDTGFSPLFFDFILMTCTPYIYMFYHPR